MENSNNMFQNELSQLDLNCFYTHHREVSWKFTVNDLARHLLDEIENQEKSLSNQ